MINSLIPVAVAKRHAAGAVANGVVLDNLLDRAFVKQEYGDDRDQMTVLQLVLVHALIIKETKDACHLMMGGRQEVDLGLVGLHVLWGAANLGDGLEALCKFYRFSSANFRLQLTTEGAYAHLAIQGQSGNAWEAVHEDIQLSYLVSCLSAYAGRLFPVAAMTTRDRSHTSLGTAHYALKAPVVLGARSEVVFPKACLAMTPAWQPAGDFLWSPVYETVKYVEAAFNPQTRKKLTQQDLKIDVLASQNNMAPSTYRRKIAQSGLSLRGLREQVLLESTLDLIHDRSWTIDAIAAELGYADARSLRRFIKRTTGQTPGELRASASAAIAPPDVLARLKDTVTSLLA
jgi:AraC-like DNA-binding protein